ncbi:uncharacterized protein EV422DRAFT_491025, partial [Fimicolochytrium jonesii]|uniref:uncharacterized protein n=1 Tax=Fimicolochytrium jonesii TaxID=1396493 RepID=UPI0022FF0DB2
MAEKCAFLSTQPPDFNTNDSIGESLTDDPRVDWEGTSADRAWRTLNEYLLEHDTPRTGYAYRSAVIDRVLQVHRSFRIPKAWITSFYDTRNPDDLIRVYLKHDLLEEAAYFVSDYVKCQEKLLRARKTAGRPLDTASRPKWLPYLLIDQTI